MTQLTDPRECRTVSLPFPLSRFHALGHATIRGVTLELPIQDVRRMLPQGLGLSECFGASTHPVMLFFSDMFDVRLSFPMAPSLNYHEMLVGIPNTRLLDHGSFFPTQAPFFYVPVLYLDDMIGVLGGKLYWGLAKKFARALVYDFDYAIESIEGHRLASLHYLPQGESWSPVRERSDFEPLRQILSQPLITQVPFGHGPGFACTDYDKAWTQARVRPIRATVKTSSLAVRGLPTRRFPETGEMFGFSPEHHLGCFELDTPFQASLLHPATWNRASHPMPIRAYGR